jgi:hypothetical protein
MIDHWMYKDAVLLKEKGRLKGCLCLLLCLVDALAKQKYPTERVKVRYVRYLKERLADLCIDESYRVEEKDGVVHISEIIYEHFRCYFVHEGDDKTDDSHEIQIEYGQPGALKILIDRRNEKIKFTIDWLTIVLLDVVDEPRVENYT